MTVRSPKPVSIIDALILALYPTFAVNMPHAFLPITSDFALANLDTLEILFWDAYSYNIVVMMFNVQLVLVVITVYVQVSLDEVLFFFRHQKQRL